MSKNKQRPPKRKVVTTSKIKPTASGRSSARSATSNTAPKELVFGKENYKWMGIGVALVALGLILMIGGAQPNPETWDPNIIYNWRITVLGPFTILAGLIVNIFAILK